MCLHIMEIKRFAHCTCGRSQGSKTPTYFHQKTTVANRKIGQNFVSTPLSLFVDVINE